MVLRQTPALGSEELLTNGILTQKKSSDGKQRPLLASCASFHRSLSQQGGVEDLDEEQQRECAANRIDMIDSEILVRESGKMVFLLGLLDNLKSEGHRCLVFSSSRKVLNILEKVLKERVCC